MQVVSWSGLKRGVLMLRRGEELHTLRVGVQHLADLNQGKDPAEMPTWQHKTLKLSAIERIELHPNDSLVTLSHRQDGKLRKLTFSGKKGIHAFCQWLAEELGLEKGQEDLDLGNALAGPIALVLVVPVVTLFALGAASDPGGAGGGAKSRGAYRLLALVGDLLGPTGLLILGGLATAGAIWAMVRRLRNRPQKTVWAQRVGA